jgi:hypothetical protein
MPTYEYECSKGHRFEIEQSMRDRAEALQGVPLEGAAADLGELLHPEGRRLVLGRLRGAKPSANSSGGDRVRSKSDSTPAAKTESKSGAKPARSPTQAVGGSARAPGRDAIASGKELAEEILADVRKRVSELRGGPPCLAVVLVGEDPASQIYVRNKGRGARACGIESREIRLPATAPEAEVLRVVDELNRDPGVHGFLVQLPLRAPSIRRAGRVAPRTWTASTRRTAAGCWPASRASTRARRSASWRSCGATRSRWRALTRW